MKKLIIGFLVILAGCASQKTIVNNDDVYEVINSYTTRNKELSSYSQVKLTRKSYQYSWLKYFREPIYIMKVVSEDETNRIKKHYDSIASKLNLNEKQIDSLYKKNSPFRLQWSEMFNEDDIQSAKKQIEVNSQKNIRWDKNKLKNVVFDKKGQTFSIPVFSKDGNYAVIYAHNTHGATLFYFEKKNGRWKWIGYSPAWIS